MVLCFGVVDTPFVVHRVVQSVCRPLFVFSVLISALRMLVCASLLHEAQWGVAQAVDRKLMSVGHLRPCANACCIAIPVSVRPWHASAPGSQCALPVGVVFRLVCMDFSQFSVLLSTVAAGCHARCVHASVPAMVRQKIDMCSSYWLLAPLDFFAACRTIGVVTNCFAMPITRTPFNTSLSLGIPN